MWTFRHVFSLGGAGPASKAKSVLARDAHYRVRSICSKAAASTKTPPQSELEQQANAMEQASLA